MLSGTERKSVEKCVLKYRIKKMKSSRQRTSQDKSRKGLIRSLKDGWHSKACETRENLVLMQPNGFKPLLNNKEKK